MFVHGARFNIKRHKAINSILNKISYEATFFSEGKNYVCFMQMRFVWQLCRKYNPATRNISVQTQNYP